MYFVIHRISYERKKNMNQASIVFCSILKTDTYQFWSLNKLILYLVIEGISFTLRFLSRDSFTILVEQTKYYNRAQRIETKTEQFILNALYEGVGFDAHLLYSIKAVYLYNDVREPVVQESPL